MLEQTLYGGWTDEDDPPRPANLDSWFMDQVMHHAVRLWRGRRPHVARRASLAHVHGQRRGRRLRRLRARGPLPEAATHRRGTPPLPLRGRGPSRWSALQQQPYRYSNALQQPYSNALQQRPKVMRDPFQHALSVYFMLRKNI